LVIIEDDEDLSHHHVHIHSIHEMLQNDARIIPFEELKNHLGAI
jgi:capsid portal protein